MSATLTVESFGAIKNAQIKLGQITIIIGPQGSGKSTIAKLLAIFQQLYHDGDIIDPPNLVEKKIFDLFKFYGIHNYLQRSSKISVKSDWADIEISGNKISAYKIHARYTSADKPLYPVYFPAERIALSMITQSIYSLLDSKVSLPDFFIKFASEFEKARNSLTQFSDSIFGINYQFKDGKNLVRQNSKTLELHETSSAIQANLPMILAIEYLSKNNYNFFVIEEPELNLFPSIQRSLVEYLTQVCYNHKGAAQQRNSLLITTHSPYILTAFDNLIQAFNVFSGNPDLNSEISKIINDKFWLDFNAVQSYFIRNGTAKNIMNKRRKSIGAHDIDKVSEEMGSIYDDLLELKYQKQ